MSASRGVEPPWRREKQLRSAQFTLASDFRDKRPAAFLEVSVRPTAPRPLATQALVKLPPLHAPPPTCPAQSIRIIDTNICKLAFRRARQWKHLVKLSCTTLIDLNAYSTNGKEDSRGTRLWISVRFNFFLFEWAHLSSPAPWGCTCLELRGKISCFYLNRQTITWAFGSFCLPLAHSSPVTWGV